MSDAPGACALIIDDGSLPALAAIVTLPPGAAAVLWHPASPGPRSERSAAAVEAHAALLEDAHVEHAAPWMALEQGQKQRSEQGQDRQPGAAAARAALLLQATCLAQQYGASRVIWPVQAGLDEQAVTAAVDLAATVTDLLEIGPHGHAGRCRVVIDLPLVDLEDDQVVDLVDDAGAPLRAFWPCIGDGGIGDWGIRDRAIGDRAIGNRGDGERPCGACAGCSRWIAAFGQVGLTWPWASHELPLKPAVP